MEGEEWARQRSKNEGKKEVWFKGCSSCTTVLKEIITLKLTFLSKATKNLANAVFARFSS